MEWAMDFVVIDNSNVDNGALGIDRSFHPHAIRANSVHSMVSQILSRLRGDTIGNLVLWGHGRPGVQGMGTGNDLAHPARDHARIIAMMGGRLLNEDQLARLNGRFARDAVVELHGCRVGAHALGRALVLRLSDLWGVTVEADAADQPSDRGNRFYNGSVIQASHPAPGQAAEIRVLRAAGHVQFD
jgi:hypothetical protein